MKKKIICIIAAVAILIAAAVAAVKLTSGGSEEYKDFDEDEQISLERSGADEYKSPVLIIYGEEDQLMGVTQLGNIVYVDNPDELPAANGIVAASMTVTVDEDGVRHGTLEYPYIEGVELATYASIKNAPEQFAESRLKMLLNISSYASIQDYRINSVDIKKTESGAEETGIITFELNCDVFPSRGSVIYGIEDPDGWCRGLTYEYTIWGTSGTWYLKGEDPIAAEALDYSGDEGGMTVTFETELYLDDNFSYRYACFETEEESILTDTPLRTEVPGSENETFDTSDDENPTDFDRWYTDLYAIDRDMNTIRVYEEDKQNLQYIYEDAYNGMIYLTTKEWHSGDGSESYMCCIDTKNNTSKQLLDNAIVLGKTTDTLYVLGLRLGDISDRARSLFAIDMATSDILWESETVFPVTSDNTLIPQGVYDGYVHLLYSYDKIPYMVDIKTGEWSFDTVR